MGKTRMAGLVWALVLAAASPCAAGTPRDLMVGGQTSTGTYTFLGEDTMETRIGEAASQFTVTASHDELILTQGTARSNFYRVGEDVEEFASEAGRHE